MAAFLAPLAKAAAKQAVKHLGQKATSAHKGDGSKKGLLALILAGLLISVSVPVVLISSMFSTLVSITGSVDPCTLQDAGFSPTSQQVAVMQWSVDAENGWGSGSKAAAARSRAVAAHVADQGVDVLTMTSGGAGGTARTTRALAKKMGMSLATPTGANQFVFARADLFTTARPGRLDLGQGLGAAWAELTATPGGSRLIVAAVQLSGSTGQAGEATRRRQVAQVHAALTRANPAKLPVILAGDFNSSPRDRLTSSTTTWLTGKGYADVETAAVSKTDVDEPTDYSGRDRYPTDRVFIPATWQASTFENTGRARSNGIDLSNHAPVRADVVMPTTGAGGSSASPEALSDIPAVALDAYRDAAAATGLDWVYLAAIGKIETNHGRFAGSSINAKGDTRPKIVNSIGASGPMQFMPATWSDFAQDGNFDGRKDVQNIYDATLAAGHKLSRQGAPADWDAALFAYNRSTAYVADVKAQARAYTAASGGMPGVPMTAFYRGTVTRTLLSAAPAATAWTRPVAGGVITARFGVPGSSWSSGYHTGTDFAVPTGTPVFAAQAGTATTNQGGAYGNSIVINHGVLEGKQVTTRYAHLSRFATTSGATVTAGQLIGYSGATGNVTGPHLHFEVMLNGAFVNPETFIAGAGAPIFVGDPSAATGCSDYLTVGDEKQNTPWGGYSNGRIPLSAMCALAARPGAYLRCDAARSLDSITAAFKDKFSTPLTVAAAYKDFATQAACSPTRTRTCEPPGQSRFGLGLVVQLSATQTASGARRTWLHQQMVANGWTTTGANTWEFGS